MKYYYFSNKDKKLAYDDNREIKIGTTHKIKGEPVLCNHGLHASKRIIDALSYAPDSILWIVELGGKVIHSNDKSVATERTYIGGGIDISETLRKFARMCALDVAHLWDCPDVMMQWLKTGDESIRKSAWASALAWDSDSARAWASAWAWASASASARAWDSAWTWDSASARAKQNKRLAQMVSKALKEVAK